MAKDKKQPTLPAEVALFLTEKAPFIRPLMDNVLRTFVSAIPQDAFQQCRLRSAQAVDPTSLKTADLDKHLRTFVRERIEDLAQFEYGLWINGRLPYITPRELQLWRLRQFVEFIWFWSLPDVEVVAMLFNATKRQASNLVSDFTARFRKTLLFPIALRRIYQMLLGPAKAENRRHQRRDAQGNVYSVPNARYLDDINSLIDEFRTLVPMTLVDAYFEDRQQNLLWIDMNVVEIARDYAKVLDEIFRMYPPPGNEADG